MIKFHKLDEDAILPQRATEGSAGYDLTAIFDAVVPVGKRLIIGTGLSVEMEKGIEMQVRSRSGLSAKLGVCVHNSPGTIDTDYFPGEIGVIIQNDGDEPFVIKKGDRIAQAVFAKYLLTDDDYTEGKRIGGFGSTSV